MSLGPLNGPLATLVTALRGLFLEETTVRKESEAARYHAQSLGSPRGPWKKDKVHSTISQDSWLGRFFQWPGLSIRFYDLQEIHDLQTNHKSDSPE